MYNRLEFEKFDGSLASHQAAAEKLANWTKPEAGEQMLPLTLEGLTAHTLGYLAYLAAERQELVGYRGVTKTYPNNCYEIGGLVVDPELRGQGYGREIANFVFGQACETFPGSTFVAFACSKSLGINKGHGFQEVHDLSEVPAEAFELCVKECPAYECAIKAGKLCCDSILSYHNL